MKALKYDTNGLLTGVVQDADSGQVLMVAMMNAEAVAATLRTHQAHFWSRSRQELWLKGGTSGNILDVQAVKVDCDGDALLLLVKPRGPACHTGNVSCFYTDLEEDHVK
ncbi:MAG: phosphoribosyl-AMP cyclohydrolase [Chloroflexota bacterium]|nr:phosphoribosyl-AMP cyclohydrolase [Chloroflexota bacterium]